MKRLIFPFLFALTSSLSAQHATHEKFSLAWTKGEVVFKTGDTINCDIRFNQTGDKPILQISHSGHTLTIPVSDVSEFSFFDSKKNRSRHFTAMEDPQSERQEYVMEKIYADGHFSILNHKTMEVPPELNFSRFLAKPIKVHKKYIYDATTGEILPLSPENLLELLEPRKNEILSYVKANNIRFRKIADFISVFEYHNSL